MTETTKPGPLEPTKTDHWAEAQRLEPMVRERLGAYSSAVSDWIFHLMEALRPLLDTHQSHARKP